LHSQAGADLEKFLTPSVSFLLDILISHSHAGAAEDLQPEKVPIKLHVRYLTLNSHSGWREARFWQVGKLPQVSLDTRELGAR